MKKRTNILYIGILLLVAVGWTSCHNQPTQKEPASKLKPLEEAEAEFRATLCRADTDTVLAQAALFMEQLKAGKVDEAIGMLHTINGLQLDTLSAEQKESYAKRFRTYPVQSYKLDYYSFSTQGNNDVKYSYDFNGEGARMSLMLNPVKIDDTWYLALKGKFNYSQEQSNPRHTRSPAPMEVVKKE